MSFKSALVALISFALVVVPAAASAQAYYLGEKNVPDDMPRPKDHPPEVGMKWRCDKNPDTGKWSILCAGWVWKDVPEPKPTQVASTPVVNTQGWDCFPQRQYCVLPATLHPHHPTGDMFKLVDPTCAPGDATMLCLWYNTSMVSAPEAQAKLTALMQATPKSEKGAKRKGDGSGWVLAGLGLLTIAAVLSGGRGGYYGCQGYTSDCTTGFWSWNGDYQQSKRHW